MPAHVRRVESVLDELPISPFDYIPANQHNAIIEFSTSYDATSDLQHAIDELVYGSSGATALAMPNGRFITTGPLHLGYGKDFRVARIIASGGPNYRGSERFRGPTISCTHSNAPGVNFQGIRMGLLRGVTLIGQNLRWIDEHNLGALDGATIDDTNAADWLDPGLDERAGSVHAPYAGICIDAYGGKRGETSYPDVDYPSFLGPLSQYDRLTSSVVTIEDVFIGGFAAGLVSQPNCDANGDFLTILRPWIEKCQYGVSVGNTQSRNVAIRDAKFFNCHTAITNAKHGTQLGVLAGPISNASLGECIQVFELSSTNYSGPTRFDHLYGEALYRLGSISATTTTESTIAFDQPRLKFTSQNETRGVPTQVLIGPGERVNIQFNGGKLDSYPSVLVLNYTSSDVSIIGTALAAADQVRANPYSKVANNALAGGLVLSKLGLPAPGSSRAPARILYRAHDLGGGLPYSRLVGPDCPSKRDRPTPIYVERHCPYNVARGYSVPVPNNVSLVDKSELDFATLEDRTLTIAFKERSDTTFMRDGPLPGDVILDERTSTVFFARSRSGLVVTAEAQNNFRKSGRGAYTQIDPVSPTVGMLYIGNSRLCMPECPVRGDFVAGSDQVSRVHGLGSTDSPLSMSFHAGDYIVVDPDAIVFETGPQGGAWVLDVVDQPRGTLLLSNVAGRTEQRRAIENVIRVPPANA